MNKIESEINKLEEHLNIKLPENFKNFLIKLENNFQNYIKDHSLDQIYTTKDSYYTIVKPHPYNAVFFKEDFGSVRISYLYTLIDNPMNTILNNFINVFQKKHESKEWLPFADDGGGGYLCIGFQKYNFDKISYINYDIQIIAESFDEFINKCKTTYK